MKPATMRLFPQNSDSAQRIRQCVGWILAQKARLLAFAREQADPWTDVELLLADTARKVAAVFCKRAMSEQDVIHYTLRSLANNARKQHRRNIARYRAEEHYRQQEQHYLQQQDSSERQELRRMLAEALQQMPEPSAATTKPLWNKHAATSPHTNHG